MSVNINYNQIKFSYQKPCVHCNKSESDSNADDESECWNNIQQVYLPHTNRQRQWNSLVLEGAEEIFGPPVVAKGFQKQTIVKQKGGNMWEKQVKATNTCPKTWLAPQGDILHFFYMQVMQAILTPGNMKSAP